MRLTQRVTIVHRGPGARDRQGNVTLVETGRDSYPCLMQQEATRELAVGRDTLVDTWRVYLPQGARIDPEDHAEFGPRLFTVEGSPYRVPDGTGTEHHVEARLRYVGEVNP